MTREEAERALDECYRELKALLRKYGAEIDVDLYPEYEGHYLRLVEHERHHRRVLAEIRLDG